MFTVLWWEVWEERNGIVCLSGGKIQLLYALKGVVYLLLLI